MMQYYNGTEREVILASASPRRQRLMGELGIPFRVMVRAIEEVCPGGEKSPEEIALCLAEMKAAQFGDEEIGPKGMLVTADTVVSLHGELIGKPESPNEAVSMLTRLSGNMHVVYTGVCIRSVEKKILFSDKTKVWFAPIPETDIIRYVEEAAPFDKAGSYGIQEWIGFAFVERIVNVMGFPTHRFWNEFTRF